MKILIVNAVCGNGSTGRICTDLHDMLIQKGHSSMVAYAHGNPMRIVPEDTYRINNVKGYYIHNAISRITDRAGFYSKKATRQFIDFIKSYKPDLIHLHNLHGYYINIELLFNYLGSTKIPIVWTLHDCWAYTGHCTHYSYIGCRKWISGCYKCPQKSNYPKSFVYDNSKKNYINKKQLFTSLQSLSITTPSVWLADEVKKSFLGKFPIFTIYNGIDLEIFKPINSNILAEIGIYNKKKILLSVASSWNSRKGLYDLIKLSSILDHSKYQQIIVGLTNKEIRNIPKEIIGISRTDSLEELVKLYSAADVFINPSYEETMGMVTAEALACGTPVIVYDKTAVPEIPDSNSGIIVDAGSIGGIINSLPKAISLDREECRKRAYCFEINQQYEAYYQLYLNITNQ